MTNVVDLRPEKRLSAAEIIGKMLCLEQRIDVLRIEMIDLHRTLSGNEPECASVARHSIDESIVLLACAVEQLIDGAYEIRGRMMKSQSQ
jgi:hypothetical protein